MVKKVHLLLQSYETLDILITDTILALFCWNWHTQHTDPMVFSSLYMNFVTNMKPYRLDPFFSHVWFHTVLISSRRNEKQHERSPSNIMEMLNPFLVARTTNIQVDCVNKWVILLLCYPKCNLGWWSEGKYWPTCSASVRRYEMIFDLETELGMSSRYVASKHQVYTVTGCGFDTRVGLVLLSVCDMNWTLIGFGLHIIYERKWKRMISSF